MDPILQLVERSSGIIDPTLGSMDMSVYSYASNRFEIDESYFRMHLQNCEAIAKEDAQSSRVGAPEKQVNGLKFSTAYRRFLTVQSEGLVNQHALPMQAFRMPHVFVKVFVALWTALVRLSLADHYQHNIALFNHITLSL